MDNPPTSAQNVQKPTILPGLVDIQARGLERMADALRLMETETRGMATAARSRDIGRFRDHRAALSVALAQYDRNEFAVGLSSGLDPLEREIAAAAAVLGADHVKGCACALCFGVR